MSISGVSSNPYASAPMLRDVSSSLQFSSDTTPIKLTDITQVYPDAIRTAPQSVIDQMNAAMKQMFTTPVGPPDNAPENTYATVKVNGKVVATLYNTGCSEMTNAAGAAMDGLEDPAGLEGPALAQWRAEQYAAKLGGTIEKAPTAINQQTWNARPPREYFFDEAAMNDFLAANQAAAAQRHTAYIQSMKTDVPKTDTERTA